MCGRYRQYQVAVVIMATTCALLPCRRGLTDQQSTTSANSTDNRPSIVVILTDDQGYADISLNPHHSDEVSTPNMDALAQDGVVFSRAYTSGHVCSPTRAGIMIGGYSQRVGIYTAGDGGRGFDPGKTIFPGFLPPEYVSTAIGKWHLGLDEDYPELKWHAMNRGFDECYKFMGRGGHSYFNLRSDVEGKFLGPIYRDRDRINDEGYLTNRLTEEAVKFIDRNKSKPFFLYLAYNAVHSPAEAPENDIKAVQARFPELSKDRAILMAMLKHLDNGVGDVVGKLKREGLFDNTLLFFLTDNGGSNAMSADNTPLRGYKQMLDEGGIRTPFVVSWPDRFKGGRRVDTPVISFDILPTALDATDSLPEKHDFDGKSLLPLLTGESRQHHETLFWSKGPEDEWAVQRSHWKLHWTKGKRELVNLANDVSETINLANSNPSKVKELGQAYDDWIATMSDPITGGARRLDGPQETTATSAEAEMPATKMTPREIERERIREARRAAKKAARNQGKSVAKAREKAGSGTPQQPEDARQTNSAPIMQRGNNAPTTSMPEPHPGSRFDLRHWKLTLPTNQANVYNGHPKEVGAQELTDSFKDSHFYMNSKGAMVFWCPVIGTTTEGTKYPRCELREMLQPGNPRHNWAMQGSHIMQAECRVLKVPSNPKVVIGQIHSDTGESKPLVKLQYYKGRIEALVKVSPVKGKDKKLTFADVKLDNEIAWKIKLTDGVLSITVNGMTQSENMIQHDQLWADQTFYFKAGVYPQDNEGNASEGALVSFSHLFVVHESD